MLQYRKLWTKQGLCRRVIVVRFGMDLEKTDNGTEKAKGMDGSKGPDVSFFPSHRGCLLDRSVTHREGREITAKAQGRRRSPALSARVPCPSPCYCYCSCSCCCRRRTRIRVARVSTSLSPCSIHPVLLVCDPRHKGLVIQGTRVSSHACFQ
jgi:hypothetical protein